MLFTSVLPEVFVSSPLVVPPITTASPFFEIQTGPTDLATILEMSVYLTHRSGTVNDLLPVGLGVPAVRGVGVYSRAPLSQLDKGNTTVSPGVTVFTQWSTVPIAPTNFLRRMTVNCNTTANGFGGYLIQFRFSNGLKMLANSSLVLWNIGGGVLSGNPSTLAFDLSIGLDS